ncbi:hypothetical protein ACMA1I_08905 [Pontibacter sp. 13R65]|uniref:hypothetical protein n=1 Tax=Pontibacter sp. 13R65 TaxID=3127458 RepID=UPI00301C3C3D
MSFYSSAQGPGNALRLDGIDDFVEFSTNDRGVTHSVTVEAWVKNTSYKYHWVVGKYDRWVNMDTTSLSRMGRQPLMVVMELEFIENPVTLRKA